jgi:hypothetical protein
VLKREIGELRFENLGDVPEWILAPVRTAFSPFSMLIPEEHGDAIQLFMVGVAARRTFSVAVIKALRCVYETPEGSSGLHRNQQSQIELMVESAAASGLVNREQMVFPSRQGNLEIGQIIAQGRRRDAASTPTEDEVNEFALALGDLRPVDVLFLKSTKHAGPIEAALSRGLNQACKWSEHELSTRMRRGIDFGLA